VPRPSLLELPAKAQSVLADLPPWYSEDEIVRAVITAMTNELQRIEDFANAVRTQMYPQNADDTYGILGMWEALFGLPVQPANATLDQRRALVKAHLQKRSSGAGSDWEAAVTQALNTNQWTYIEGPGDYQVTVRFPFVAGGYTASQAVVLIQDITPAHLELVVGYTGGWLAGVSLVGVDPL
jgi:hypothetical protein